MHRPRWASSNQHEENLGYVPRIRGGKAAFTCRHINIYAKRPRQKHRGNSSVATTRTYRSQPLSRATLQEMGRRASHFDIFHETGNRERENSSMILSEKTPACSHNSLYPITKRNVIVRRHLLAQKKRYPFLGYCCRYTRERKKNEGSSQI